MFTKTKIIFVITVLCLTIPFSVLAKKPQKGEWAGFFDAEPAIDCGDYTIFDNIVFEVSWIDFFDKSGDWIRTFENYRIYEDFYRDGKPVHLSSKSEFHVQAFYFDGEWQYEQRQGLFNQVTVPGYGNLFIQAGRIMRDSDGFFFEKGQGMGDFEASTAKLCDHLRQE